MVVCDHFVQLNKCLFGERICQNLYSVIDGSSATYKVFFFFFLIRVLKEKCMTFFCGERNDIWLI